MNIADFDWQYRTGRDRDGDMICSHVLVHGSGRIYAAILAPATPDEYRHRVFFECRVPAGVLEGECSVDFVDLESAKKFVEKAIVNRREVQAAGKPRKKRVNALVNKVYLANLEEAAAEMSKFIDSYGGEFKEIDSSPETIA